MLILLIFSAKAPLRPLPSNVLRLSSVSSRIAFAIVSLALTLWQPGTV